MRRTDGETVTGSDSAGEEQCVKEKEMGIGVLGGGGFVLGVLVQSVEHESLLRDLVSIGFG